MSRILSGLLILILLGCDLIYEDNLRWRVLAQLTDNLQHPVEDILVTVEASNFADTDLIGSNRSDQAGDLQVRTISPGNASELRFYINSTPDQRLVSEEYRGVQIIYPLSGSYLEDIKNDNYTLDLGLIKLSKIVDFELTIERVTDGLDTLIWQLEYPQEIQLISQEPDPLSFPNRIGGQLLPNQALQIEDFKTAQSDTLWFDYTLQNQTQISNRIPIIVNPQTTKYAFTF